MNHSLGLVMHGDAWLIALRRYSAFIAAANLAWEFLHLPLYTIWTEGSTRELVFAAIHCTGGDVLIAIASLLLALILVGEGAWPVRGFGKVTMLTIALGLSYTVFSEWLNTVVRESWSYSERMPVIPLVGVGLSPFAQWLIIPLSGFWWAQRPFHDRNRAMING